MTQDDIAQWLQRAKAAGLHGFGGACGAAAIAINRTIFGGQGQLLGGLNEAFLDHGRLVGHIAVAHDQIVWDADGRPKDEVELEAWGMLDQEDPDYQCQARTLGITWTENAASSACIFEFDNEIEIINHFGDDHLADYVRALEMCRPR